MKHLLIAVLCAVTGGQVMADTVLAARTIPARTVIGPADITLHAADMIGAVSDPQDAIGMEARVALYAGRPIRHGDIGVPAIVERNDIVTLHYAGNGIAIATEGRALGRAGVGDSLRVMNLSSRATITARIGNDGVAYVAR